MLIFDLSIRVTGKACDYALEIALIATGGAHSRIVSPEYRHHFVGHLVIPFKMTFENDKLWTQFLGHKS